MNFETCLNRRKNALFRATPEETKKFPKFEVDMEDNEEVLGIFQQKSASVSGTLSWTRDLSNMPRIPKK